MIFFPSCSLSLLLSISNFCCELLNICASDLVNLLPLFEELKCWHRRYATFLCDIFRFINIDLCKDYMGRRFVLLG